MHTGAINGVGKDEVVDVASADRADSSQDGSGKGDERELHGYNEETGDFVLLGWLAAGM